MRKTLAVGHFYNAPFQESCQPHLGRIREVFYAWPGVLSCRPAPEFTPELRARLVGDLKWCRANGVLLDTLFNCNCYGDIAVSPARRDCSPTSSRPPRRSSRPSCVSVSRP